MADGFQQRASLVSQTYDGILFRRPPGGDDAENDAHGNRDAEGDEHRERRHDRVDLGDALDPEAQDAAEDDAGHAARETDEHRLAQELREDVALAGSARAPHPAL